MSWPGFVLGIENKVWSAEHEGQTASYSRWLRRLRRARSKTAAFLLSPSGVPAQSPDFTPLSYLELARHLLEPPVRTELTAAERQILTGYMKTLRRRILSREFNAIADMEDL